MIARPDKNRLRLTIASRIQFIFLSKDWEKANKYYYYYYWLLFFSFSHRLFGYSSALVMINIHCFRYTLWLFHFVLNIVSQKYWFLRWILHRSPMHRSLRWPRFQPSLFSRLYSGPLAVTSHRSHHRSLVPTRESPLPIKSDWFMKPTVFCTDSSVVRQSRHLHGCEWAVGGVSSGGNGGNHGNSSHGWNACSYDSSRESFLMKFKFSFVYRRIKHLRLFYIINI